MKLLLIYAAGFFVFISWAAWKDCDMRASYLVALFWPLALGYMPLLIGTDWLSKRGWRIDVEKPPEHLRTWGVRKAPTWDRSWAVRCPWLELQVWYAPARDRHAANVAAVRGEKPK